MKTGKSKAIHASSQQRKSRMKVPQARGPRSADSETAGSASLLSRLHSLSRLMPLGRRAGPDQSGYRDRVGGGLRVRVAPLPVTRRNARRVGPGVTARSRPAPVRPGAQAPPSHGKALRLRLVQAAREPRITRLGYTGMLLTGADIMILAANRSLVS